jgi:TPR repeat protein
MASMDMNDPKRQNPPGNNRGPDPRSRGPPGGDPYGRPSGESQRNMPPKGYPPQQGYGLSQGQRQGPGPGPGSGRPSQQNSYGPSGYDQRQQAASTPTSPINGGFGPISRSMTMPNDISSGANGGPRHPPQDSMNGPGPSAPYNGPVGRGPPRPATASDARPPPHRTYPQQGSQPPHSNGNVARAGEQDYSHQPSESISDLYDAYYEPKPLDNTPGVGGPHRQGTSMDGGYPMANSSAMPQRQQVNGYPQMNHTKSQPDFRAQVQPQSAVYEMAGEMPPMPNGQARAPGYPVDPNGQYGNRNPTQNAQGGPQGAAQWYDQTEQIVGIPPTISPLGRGGYGVYNNINNGKPNMDGLPSHPAPVRAGLIPNSVANQANNKPPPVRNYNNVSGPGGTHGQSTTPSAKDPPTPVTLEEIERLQIFVRNNPSDQGTQLTLAKKWIEAADVLVPLLPDPKSRTKAREKYIFDAHKMLKKLIAAQHADAMFYMADCYGRGFLGLEPDNKEAFSLYQSAAKAGHAAAAYRTAVCCELGNEEGGGTRKDPLKAIQWYKRAAILGDPPAMYKMGMIQLKGLLGQPKNPREAIGWLKRAAERADAENPHALHELGLLYESAQPPDGSGPVIRDEAYALSLFKQAAELGYKFSQFRLGCAYEYGLFNLQIDARQSIMWYSKAAVQEEHQSELALSGWYLTGSEGVLQQSDTEAYLWARKAAIAGLAKAEYAMGYFTEVGIGAPADLEGAKRWYWRAAGS